MAKARQTKSTRRLVKPKDSSLGFALGTALLRTPEERRKKREISIFVYERKNGTFEAREFAAITIATPTCIFFDLRM